MERYWLVEVESNYPRELEIRAESKEEAVENRTIRTVGYSKVGNW